MPQLSSFRLVTADGLIGIELLADYAWALIERGWAPILGERPAGNTYGRGPYPIVEDTLEVVTKTALTELGHDAITVITRIQRMLELGAAFGVGDSAMPVYLEVQTAGGIIVRSVVYGGRFEVADDLYDVPAANVPITGILTLRRVAAFFANEQAGTATVTGPSYTDFPAYFPAPTEQRSPITVTIGWLNSLIAQDPNTAPNNKGQGVIIVRDEATTLRAAAIADLGVAVLTGTTTQIATDTTGIPGNRVFYFGTGAVEAQWSRPLLGPLEGRRVAVFAAVKRGGANGTMTLQARVRMENTAANNFLPVPPRSIPGPIVSLPFGYQAHIVSLGTLTLPFGFSHIGLLCQGTGDISLGVLVAVELTEETAIVALSEVDVRASKFSVVLDPSALLWPEAQVVATVEANATRAPMPFTGDPYVALRSNALRIYPMLCYATWFSWPNYQASGLEAFGISVRRRQAFAVPP